MSELPEISSEELALRRLFVAYARTLKRDLADMSSQPRAFVLVVVPINKPGQCHLVTNLDDPADTKRLLQIAATHDEASEQVTYFPLGDH